MVTDRKTKTKRNKEKQMKKLGSEIASTVAQASRHSALIQDFQVCGTQAKIRVQVVASDTVSRKEILSGLNEKFQGKLRAVPRSFRITESSSADRNNVIATVEGYVVPNVQVIVASDERAGKMKEVAANMFLDDSDCIWNKTGEFLYKKSDVETSEGLQALLAECSSEGARPTRMRKADAFLGPQEISSGDFVSYMNRGEMGCGFIIAADPANRKVMVLAQNEEEPEVIDAFQVQDVLAMDETQIKYPQEQELSGAVDVNALLAYYKRMYIYNPSYFQELENRIRGYAFM